MSEIYIKPFEWRGEDEKDGYYINIIGHDENNDTRMVRIKYYPWFYIGIPDNDEVKIVELLDYLYGKIKGIVSHEIEEKKNMWGYNAGNIKVVKIRFDKMIGLYTCRKELNKEINGVKYKYYETEVNQVSKFQAEKKFLYTDWLVCNKYKEIKGSIRKSLCNTEYVVGSSNIESVKDEKTKEKLGIKLPSIVSFDLEVNATNTKAMPKSYEPDDVIFCCVVDYENKSKNRAERHLIVLEECKPKEKCIIHIVKDEKEMADKFCDLMLELDPDIILGHNIMKFDFPYWEARLFRTNNVFKQMSRYKNYETKMEKMSWESSAYNEIELTYPDCPGRIILDTLPFFQRSHKLLNYKLETIAKEFLGIGKNPVSPEDIFNLYRKHDPISLGIIADYCLKDCHLPKELFWKANIWFELLETANVVRVPIIYLYTRGQGIRVFSQEYYELYNEGYLVIPKKVPKTTYEGGYVVDGKPGLYRNVLCFDFASLYPSIIISHNFCYTTLVDENDPISDDKCHVIEWKDSKTGVSYRYRWIKKEYKQGILPPLLSKLASERKRIRAEMGPLEEKIKDGTITPAELLRYQTLDARQKGIKISMNSVYGDKGSYMSTLPLLEAAMCTTYKGRESIMKTSKILEEKFGAKTVYGDTDSTMVIIPGFEKHKKHAKEIGEKIAAAASSYFLAPMKLEFEKVFEDMLLLGKKMYVALLMDLKNPLVTAISLSGKDLKKRLFSRGVKISRRDNCAFLQSLYEKVIFKIFARDSRESLLSFVETQLRLLLSRQVAFNDLIITKKLGKNYKSPSFPLAIFHTYLKNRGEILEPGDRLEYVLVELDQNTKSLQGDKMQSPKFFYLDGNIIDVDYYLTNLVSNCINDLISLAYPSIPDNYLIKRFYPHFKSRSLYLNDIKKLYRPL